MLQSSIVHTWGAWLQRCIRICMRRQESKGVIIHHWFCLMDSALGRSSRTASILSRYTLVSGCAYAGMHLSLMINPTTRDPKKEKLHIGLGVSAPICWWWCDNNFRPILFAVYSGCARYTDYDMDYVWLSHDKSLRPRIEGLFPPLSLRHHVRTAAYAVL